MSKLDDLFERARNQGVELPNLPPEPALAAVQIAWHLGWDWPPAVLLDMSIEEAENTEWPSALSWGPPPPIDTDGLGLIWSHGA